MCMGWTNGELAATNMPIKLNLNYYIDNILTKDEQQEIYDYFMQAKEDNIKQAYKVLGGYYNEEDIRLMRIKFMSEVAN